jgi:SDR family mycofactocin-dependent oxidoreductase
MGELEGKVALITGAARGQGRSHAVALAEQGVDIIAVDLCRDIDTVSYTLATAADLEETVRLVEEQGRRIVAFPADVRDMKSLSSALEGGLKELGRLDIVLVNAGIAPESLPEADATQSWANVIDVNLTGAWNTTRLSKEVLVKGGRGGSIVITSSTAGLKGISDGTAAGEAYVASKHGLVGLMRALSLELAPHSIRVNTVHPTGTNTFMVQNPAMRQWIAEHAEVAAAGMQNALPVELIEPSDVTNAILWLVSDKARYVTGVALPVDAGFTVR